MDDGAATSRGYRRGRTSDGGRRHCGRTLRYLTVLVIVAAFMAIGAAGTAAANQPPSAGIDYTPSDPSAGDTVTFEASASDTDGEIESFGWTVDGERVSSAMAFTRTFDNGGDYTVRLTVRDDDGATTQAQQTVAVAGGGGNLSVSIDHSRTPRVGEPVTLRADADPSAESYIWQFGDGTTGSGEQASHIYGSGGSYEVSVTASDDEEQASDTIQLQVSDLDPDAPRVAIVGPSVQPRQGRSVEFRADASDPNGQIADYAWWVDGEPVGDDERLTHSFEDAGGHDVRLMVTDSEDITANASTTVQVTATNDVPAATIAYDPVAPETGEEVTFTADASDPDGTIAAYEWTIDGEVVGDGPSYVHTYEAAGESAVELTVTDDSGATTTADTSLTVLAGDGAEDGGEVDGEDGGDTNASDADTDDESDEEGMPGFGAIVALGALALASVVAMRGRQRR